MGVGDVSCTWSQGLTLFSGPPGEAEEGAGVRRSLGLLRARSLGTGGPWPGGLEKSGSGVLLSKEEGPGKKRRLDTRCVGNPQDPCPMPGPQGLGEPSTPRGTGSTPARALAVIRRSLVGGAPAESSGLAGEDASCSRQGTWAGGPAAPQRLHPAHAAAARTPLPRDAGAACPHKPCRRADGRGGGQGEAGGGRKLTRCGWRKRRRTHPEVGNVGGGGSGRSNSSPVLRGEGVCPNTSKLSPGPAGAGPGGGEG